MSEKPGIEIFDVDFIQTGTMAEGTGSLIIEMGFADGSEMVRTHRNVPESLYEAWEKDGFTPEMYAAKIEKAYPFTIDFDDDDEDDEN